MRRLLLACLLVGAGVLLGRGGTPDEAAERVRAVSGEARREACAELRAYAADRADAAELPSALAGLSAAVDGRERAAELAARLGCEG